MNSASPQLAEEIPEQQLKAMFTLMQNTTFLWNSLVNLETDKQAFTCPIRQSTYTKIKESLHLLCETGYFEFNLIYDTASRHHPVMDLEISEIKNNFLTIVRTLALTTDPKHPPPNGQDQTETPASIHARRQISRTQPLTRPAQATWPMPKMILKKWPAKPFWYVIILVFILSLGWQWFNWLFPSLDAVNKESGQIIDTRKTLDLTPGPEATFTTDQPQMSLDCPLCHFSSQ